MDLGGWISADEPVAVLAWWDDAGVGAPVSEVPRDWLATARPAPAAATPPSPTSFPAPVGLPNTLDAFVRWRLEGDDAPEATWGSPRISPGGGNPDTVVLVDMPEREDESALLEGAVGRLFDRMLASIGLDRDRIHLTALAWARPPGGRLDAELTARLAALTRHHLSLLAPKRVLVMGHATARALLSVELADARGGQQTVDVDKAALPAVATFHPRLLMQTPPAKAEAWRDLLAFKRMIATP